MVAEHRELQVLSGRGGVQGAAAGCGRSAARAGRADSKVRVKDTPFVRSKCGLSNGALDFSSYHFYCCFVSVCRSSRLLSRVLLFLQFRGFVFVSVRVSRDSS